MSKTNYLNVVLSMFLLCYTLILGLFWNTIHLPEFDIIVRTTFLGLSIDNPVQLISYLLLIPPSISLILYWANVYSLDKKEKMKNDKQIEKQLDEAIEDMDREPSTNTQSYIDALNWVLNKGED